MRARPLLFAFFAPLVAGCGDFGDGYGYGFDDNEIVFGIRQKIDASGDAVVTAGYEYLGLSRRGGWRAHVFRDGEGDGMCYFERYGERLGQLHVEGGTARWTGGLLPASGLRVVANQPEPSQVEGLGWRSNDVLVFDVAGFAMPRLEPVSMKAPPAELAITDVSPTPPGGASEIMPLRQDDDVRISWRPQARGVAANVMLTLEVDTADGPGVGVRCFGAPDAGTLSIPRTWVERLFSSVASTERIQGRLGVSSHRQVTYHARGGWRVYIVAATQHLERPFDGVRE